MEERQWITCRNTEAGCRTPSLKKVGNTPIVSNRLKMGVREEEEGEGKSSGAGENARCAINVRKNIEPGLGPGYNAAGHGEEWIAGIKNFNPYSQRMIGKKERRVATSYSGANGKTSREEGNTG